MRLTELVDELSPVAVRGDLSVEVTTVAYDSRRVGRGALFCCVPGALADGHDFAPAAVEAGATALLVERPLGLGVAELEVPDARVAMAPAAAAVAGHPSHDLAVVGVTGTNGKTTTTHLLAGITSAAGRPSAVLGTLSGPRTTPEAPDLQEWLAARRDDGTSVVAMEVSSHSLTLHRVDATRFAVAVFTNLSRDHLDFHGTMEAYFEAKARLFTPELSAAAVVNLDDPYGRLLRDSATIPTFGYSLADASDLDVGAGACRFTWRGEPVALPLGGRFNVANALAAAEAALLLGLDAATVARGLSTPVAVPGRFEPVDAGQPFRVVVDFAHTPDALERVLEAAREVAGSARVHVVFGCGGDRDASKRPAMGAVAARLADRVVLTADNSRSEATAAIIGAVQDGYDHTAGRTATELVVEPDRDAAIGLALAGAGEGDVVVIAGKGHETTQTIGDHVTPFDDRLVARAHLGALGWPGSEEGLR
jgi:UDP-N-acetylmuramoyl-L-alanyl-D-glutamate--2,6-diaminopimelate ligase